MCQPTSERTRASVRVIGIAVLALASILLAGGEAAPRGQGQVDRTQSHPTVKPPQEKVTSLQTSLKNEVTVTLKLVQVIVTDAKGKPALDLEKADFVLYDNGKLQTITDFEKHFIGAPKESAAEGRLPSGRDARSLMNRKFIFLVDYLTNDLEGLAKSRRAAKEFLDAKAQPGDEIALFSFSTATGLTLHEYFTTDHEKIRTGLRKMRDVPGVGGGWDSFEEFGHEPMGMEVLGAEVSKLRHAGNSSLDFFSQMAEWAKALARVPGQKSIIYFSRGFAKDGIRLGNPLYLRFEAMVRGLASANAPVFTVNTTTGVGAKVAAGAFPEGSLEQMSQMTGGKYFNDVNYYARNAEELHNLTGNYYVLGYRLGAAWDGRFHELKVDVKKPGHRVYGQRGYFNPLPFNKLSEAEKHLQLIDMALGERAYMGSRVSFPMIAVPYSRWAPKVRRRDRPETGGLATARDVFLISEISPEGIREDVGDSTEVFSLVLDEHQAIVSSQRVLFDWSKSKSEREKLLQYSSVAIRPGRYECRVVVRNVDDGRCAVGSCSVIVPEGETIAETAADKARMPEGTPGPANIIGFRLDMPLLLIEGKEVSYLNFVPPAPGQTGKERGAGKAASAAGQSLFDVFPFPAKQYRPLVGELANGATDLYAVLRCRRAGRIEMTGAVAGQLRAELEVAVRAAVIPASGGEETPVSVDVLNVTNERTIPGNEAGAIEMKQPDAEPGDIMLLGFDLPELAPGPYKLRIDAEGASVMVEFAVGPGPSTGKY